MRLPAVIFLSVFLLSTPAFANCVEASSAVMSLVQIILRLPGAILTLIGLSKLFRLRTAKPQPEKTEAVRSGDPLSKRKAMIYLSAGIIVLLLSFFLRQINQNLAELPVTLHMNPLRCCTVEEKGCGKGMWSCEDTHCAGNECSTCGVKVCTICDGK